jgi:hypothetical protein
VRRVATAGLILWLAAPAAARSRSTFELSVEPNLELLGVVQRLADASPLPAEDDYRRDADAAFGRFKDHPAVRLYAETRRAAKGREGFGINLLYYTPASALELKDPSSRPPYMIDGAERETMARFLEALRDFSERSDFPRFFRAHRSLYRGIEDAARRDLGPVDPVRRLEAYLGIGLESRCRYLLTPLYRNESLSSFIEPYPDPWARASEIKKPFEVYTITPYELSGEEGVAHSDLGKPSGRLWQEPLYVFIDPSFYFFDAANAPDPTAFLRLDVPGCPPQAVNCAKALVVQALVDRLNSQAYGATSDPGTGERARYVKALEARLEEYEGKRGEYPTLWSFYPRLFHVFRELKPGGAPEATLRLPGGPVFKTTDFFGPAMR